MFDFVREHKKWMQVVLALLIVPSFVFVGVSSYGGGGGVGATEVANVGGTKITQLEWENAQRMQIDNARAQFGERFDQKMFESPEAKQYVLDSLVRQRAVDTEIAKTHMTVGDAALQKTIAETQFFKGADGKFDMAQYKALLQAQGMTPKQYDAQVRRSLTLNQINNAIVSSAFVPRSVATRLSEIGEQEREVQELLFPVADFLPQVKITDAMVQAYYDKNAARFQVPEQVKVEYVVLDAAAVESQVVVSDADALKFYEENKAKSFTSKEERKVSHILINAPKDASAADKAAAKAKADAILADLRKAPASFADVAKAQSQDPSSADLGGDLGVITKPEDTASPEVGAVAFKLKQGDISDLVSSEFGYHVVTVTSLKPATVKAFDEVKGEVVAELKKSLISKKYGEMAEKFSDMVYEQSDSLKPVADQLKLKIETVDNLARTPSPALQASPVSNAKFLKAIFSDEALNKKRNTEAVEVAPSTLVAGRVVQYKPAAKRPLAEVDADIRRAVTADEAIKLAKQAGEAKIAAAKAAGDAAGFGAAKVLTRTRQPEIELGAFAAVMKADASKLPAYVGVDLPGVGYGVYRINKVSQPAQPDVARRAAERQQINELVAQQEMYAYVEALKTKAKTKVIAKTAATDEAAAK